jgi:hypothetical protein
MDARAVPLGNTGSKRQAQSGTRLDFDAGVGSAIETLENQISIRFGNAGTGVGNFQHNRPEPLISYGWAMRPDESVPGRLKVCANGFSCQTYCHYSALRRILQGIIEQHKHQPAYGDIVRQDQKLFGSSATVKLD